MSLDLRRRHNRRFVLDIIAVALTLMAASAFATETASEQRQSFSSGHLVGSEAVEGVKPDTSAVPQTKQRNSVQQSIATGFYIYSAQATLYFDDDRDGHFYGIDIEFDADTDFFSADVYARLYLSFENGPWEEYFVTDYFTIFGASGLDDYLVETELFSGYPTGYYDVLIELYDEFDDLVASFGPNDASDLSLLPLEDQQKDAPFIETVTVTASRGGGGGAAGIPALVALGMLAWLRRNSA